MLTNIQISDIFDKIIRCTHPAQMYLFGSYAHGNPQENSDLDVAVIKETLPNKQDEIVRIKRAIASSEYSVDLLLFSKDEFELKKSQGWRVIEEITTRGTLIPC